MPLILSIKNLSVALESAAAIHAIQWVLHEINIDVEQGSCVGLVGESGSGKTMIARAILQMLPPRARVSTDSVILFQQTDLLTLSSKAMRAYRGKKIGVIFQDPMSAFNPVLRVGYQIDEGRRGRKNKIVTLDLLEKVGIVEAERCYNAYPHELSGGMRQRAMIAMALSGDPALIIADEPTTAIDVTLQAQILEVLQTLRREKNVTVLFISHQLPLVAEIADRIIVLEQGRVIKNANGAWHDSIHSTQPTVCHTMCHNDTLHIKNLCVTVGHRSTSRGVAVVKNVSLDIESGKTVALVGESGSGKTTLAKALVGLLPITSGEIVWASSHAERSTNHAVSPIHMIFQDPAASLNPRRTIGQSILEAGDVDVEALLERVGLSKDRQHAYPHAFSGGEKQRICIARVLAVKPRCLILDEPTSALDSSLQRRILLLLRALQRQDSIAYLLITHDFSVVSYLADTVAVMHAGQIVERGSVRSVLQHPKHPYTQRLIAAIPRLQRSIIMGPNSL